MVHNPKNEHIDFFFVYGLSVCLVIVLSLTSFFMPKKEERVAVAKKEGIISTQVFFDERVFSNIEVGAKAYIVYDLLTHETIASKNETLQLPLASLTKVMTAISATLHTPKDKKIVVTSKSIEDGYDLGLKNRQIWSLPELLKYTLVFSSNDGAEIIADSSGGRDLFIAQMNGDAKALGLNLYFTNPAGLDLGGKIGGKGTALDTAKLFGVARKTIPGVLDATTKRRQTVVASSGKISGIPNTNQAIENLPGAEASKTGFTDMAGGNLGVIVDISVGHPVVIIVLGSTREGRFKDVELLYETLRKSLVLSNTKH